MKKKGYKRRCEKRSLSKCVGICRTYDHIQSAYADRLEANEQVKEFQCNVLLEGLDNYELSNPTACKEMMGEFRVNNDPVTQFAEEILNECKWDLLPNQFLYDLYLAWHKENCPNSIALNKSHFLRDIRRVLEKSPVWDCPVAAVSVGTKMNEAEPLIKRYELEKWFNPSYKGTEVEKICHPELATSYRGILRR